MKKIITLTMASALFLPQPFLYADESHHPEKQRLKTEAQTQEKLAQGGMMGKMEEHMQKMMRQMDEIHKTGDPDKREKLLQEHMQGMHEGMEMMRDISGGTMKGMMSDGGSGSMMMCKKMHRGSGAMGCDDRGMHHRQMEKRMDMMQMMVEHMMQHQRAERPYQGCGKFE